MVTAVELKFNCFFLMPLIDTFPTRLREELEAAYEEDLDEVCPRALRVEVQKPDSEAQKRRPTSSTADDLLRGGFGRCHVAVPCSTIGWFLHP